MVNQTTGSTHPGLENHAKSVTQKSATSKKKGDKKEADDDQKKKPKDEECGTCCTCMSVALIPLAIIGGLLLGRN